MSWPVPFSSVRKSALTDAAPPPAGTPLRGIPGCAKAGPQRRGVRGAGLPAAHSRRDQQELAQRTGTSPTAVVRMEGGDRTPTFATLEKLVTRHGCVRLRLSAEGIVDPPAVWFGKATERSATGHDHATRVGCGPRACTWDLRRVSGHRLAPPWPRDQTASCSGLPTSHTPWRSASSAIGLPRAR
ncbi:MAG: helix-turn-helix transcriptional regulator [Euzebyaceae bacterium]|nr:helix-turn-helix transcriptional regulator [Euzebyaceae bacterium]